MNNYENNGLCTSINAFGEKCIGKAQSHRIKLCTMCMNFDIAIRNGDFETVKMLVSDGRDVNECDSLAIKTACRIGDVNTVKYLIEQGSRLYDTLELACATITSSNCNRIELVKFLIEKLTSLTPEHHQLIKDYALMYASRSFFSETMKSNHSETILADNFETIKYLIEIGADMHFNRDELYFNCYMHLNEKRALYVFRQYKTYPKMFGQNTPSLAIITRENFYSVFESCFNTENKMYAEMTNQFLYDSRIWKNVALFIR